MDVSLTVKFDSTVAADQNDNAARRAIEFCKFVCSQGHDITEFDIKVERTADPNWLTFTAIKKS